jgi:hypothetical protein
MAVTEMCPCWRWRGAFPQVETDATRRHGGRRHYLFLVLVLLLFFVRLSRLALLLLRLLRLLLLHDPYGVLSTWLTD